MVKFFVIATPIGNLKDISQRALETLQRVDLILCEDTRQTQKLLNHFQINKPTVSYHQHSGIAKIDKIIKLLEEGKELALVSDAGTPGISDPGNKLIQELSTRKVLVDFIPIPGPSALIVAASISGFPMERFLFLGFPPAKNKRQKFFQQVADSKYPVVLYESCHRILKTLNDLSSCTELSSVQIVVCRELTKLYETTYRGTPEQVIEQLKNSTIKGEFVIIVAKS